MIFSLSARKVMQVYVHNVQKRSTRFDQYVTTGFVCGSYTLNGDFVHAKSEVRQDKCCTGPMPLQYDGGRIDVDVETLSSQMNGFTVRVGGQYVE